jgi:hypothetical protein
MLERGDEGTCRRNFLRVSTMGAVASPLLLVANQELGTDSISSQQADPPAHRIKQLSLRTAVPLNEMADFYRDVLDMKVQLSQQQLIVEAGATKIQFTPAEAGTRPYYHFAFNIPENKILSARKWLGERTKLATTPVGARESGMPNDIRPFNHWNSHSLFFWDPAGNILELICRHDLKNSTSGEFRSDEIFYASEIGFVTEDVNKLAGNIRSTFQLNQYGGGGSSFRAIGDETGLLIIFKRGGSPVGAQPGQTWQINPIDVVVRSEVKFESETDPHSIKAS